VRQSEADPQAGGERGQHRVDEPRWVNYARSAYKTRRDPASRRYYAPGA